MKIYFGGILNETNVSSPIPCAEEDFLDIGCAWRDQADGPFAPLLALGGAITVGPNRVAQPAGLVTRDAYAALVDQLAAALTAQGPFEAVLLNLHGAMAAEHLGDCEGDILARVRAIVGPSVFVGATLDPHCHVSRAMIEQADALVCYKQYPHTDIDETTRALAELCAARLRGGPALGHALFDCRQLDIYYTTRQPMQGIVEAARRHEARDGIASVSIAHGFPWGDDPDIGTKVLVYGTAPQVDLDAVAEDIGRQMIAARGLCGAQTTTPAEAIALAAQPGLTVAADIADNAGGGAPSDSTFFLDALLKAGIGPAAVGPIWDPGAVAFCFKAGLGARIQLRVGGKAGRVSGLPVDVDGEVIALARDHQEVAPGFGGLTVSFGDVAGVRVGGLILVLSQVRMQGFSPAVFEAAGVVPSEQRLIVVKSTQHFHAGFAPIAARIVYVDAGGALGYDFARLPYRKAPADLWPREQAS